MIADTGDDSLLWWEKPGFNWHHYSKIMFDPIRIRIDTKKVEEKFDPEELAAFSSDITKSVIEKLEPEYPVIETPGTDVLRIHAEIIDIDESNPVINLATTVAVFVPLDVGGAAISVELFDSITGERLAAMVDRKTGSPFQLVGGFSRFRHARAAFDQWAEALNWP